MKKRFTILSAALALLTFLAVPMGMWGQTTYEQLTSIANIDESAQYVLGIDGTGFHYEGTSSWGKTALPSAQTPIYYTLTKASDGNSFTAKATIGNTIYYLQVPTSNTFSMATSTGTNTDLIIGTTQVSGTNYAVANKTTTARHLRINGTSGLRSYAGTTGSMAFFYKVSGSSMSVSPTSIDFGSNNTINPEDPYTETFEVTFSNLTENLTVTGFSGVMVSPTSINYDATSPQTVTVSYNPTAAGSISGNISVNSSEVDEALVAVTGSAYDPANIDTYERYTGALVEGDYIICANAEVAMKNVISGNRFANEAVTVTNNAITNPDASIIWHIAPDGDYWTIYNAAVNKYAAGTYSNNQGTLLDAVTDHARWDITYQYSNYTVICYGRNSSSNKYLRRNGDYGWATYANSTGQVPTFYKKVGANQVATPTFSLVEGTYFETQSVTLNCSTDGATIYYTTDGTTPSASNGTVYTTAISVSTTTTIKAIAIATGMTDSDVATATYTIEQPYSTIPALFGAATNIEQDVRVTFNNWVVSGVSTNGRSVYVTDNSGNGFIIYFTSDMSGTFAAGNILSGTAVACKLKLYNGAAELVNLTATDLTITTGGTVSISNIPMSDLSGVNTGALVSYNNLTCSVSDNKYYLTDGTTTLQAYNTLYAFNEFVAGKTYNVTGVYVQYNSIKEIAPRCTTDIEEAQASQYTLTVTASENVEIFTFVGESTDPAVEGPTTQQVTSGTEVGISVSVPEGYILTLTVDDTDVTSLLDETGYYTFSMPAHDVTVSATAVEATPPTPFEPATYTLATSIESGKTYIIVGQGDGNYYAMGSQKPNNRDAVRISVDGTTATVLNEAVYEFTISSLADAGFYSIYEARTPGYLYAAGSNGNYLRTEDNLSDNSKWEITFGSEGNASVVATNSDNRNVMQFNSTSSNKLFSCYTSASQHPVFLYVKDETTPDYYTLTINGYAEGSRGGYYLIASPVTVDPATVGGMTEGDFDLYYYDQAQDREWINYKVGDDGTGGPFDLIPGNGYLYAKKATPETTTYNFPLMGTPYSGNGQVFLHKSVENEIMSGWNLVGNPFAQTAYIDRDFYVMKDNGEEIITANRENNEVNRMEGVFVIANSDNEPLTFSTTPIANSGSKLVLNLSQGRGIVDRAIVRFGEGRTLPKFMLNNENTKLYIPQEGNDYAVVYAENQGELPLNFKAAEDGTYTLSFSNENAEFSSLHLIDNMSRADIDLLANPSYTFDAQATDEETRFTLVYEKAGSTLTIGTGSNYSGSGYQEPTATDYGAGSPMGNTYFTYSTAQFIYTAEEMSGAKTINSLAFKHNNFGSFIGTVKIYLVHTSNSEVHVSNPATSGTLVYTGTNITLGSNSNEWQTFNLDTPFEYDGSHNLLVVVCRTKATSGTPNYNVDQGWQYTTYSGHYRYMVRSKSISTYGDITNTEHYVRGFKRPNIKFGYTAPVVNHFDLNIKGWTSNNNNYYLIASPIGQVNPSDVTNMLSNSYDLFYFDQAGDDQGYEWITYKAGEGATDPGFNLVPGKGYLYANSGIATNNPNIVTLTFTGSAYTGSGQVYLVYTEDNPVPYMRGWNLVGNPFGVDAYIDRSYYAMNSDGTEIEPHSGVIAPMQGLFVHVDQNETMTFTTTPPSKGSSLSLNVSKGRGIIDRAILNFSEGRQLPKFQLNPNHTKVYMPVEGTDYAVISTEEQGEMPVSFKAEENGTYTFSFDTENVELGYLHLIDNKTGVNVDLLSTPSYSFEAKTTDYESRFKLVFAAICEDADGDSETFAFYSNGSFVINNEGVATLQVIDVMGRIISSESINGSANVNINAADGVYMLRLINGERVKTQKVVVK